jgi:hypothetical protein
MEIRRLAARGHPVTVIGDAQFWRLVESASASRKGGRSEKSGASRRRGASRARQLLH